MKIETVTQPPGRPLFSGMTAVFAILVILLPFAILTLFIHPQADDFDASTATQRMGYFNALTAIYNGWNGRWFSTALMLANPMAFGNIAGCKIIPVTILVLLCCAFVALVKALVPELKSRTEIWLCGLALVALYLSNMPSIVQGFYWMSASIHYQLASVLMLALWSQIGRIAGGHTGQPITGALAAGIFFLFAAIGSNETSMSLTVILLAAAFLWRSVIKGKPDGLFAGLLALGVVAMAVVVLAPGNHVRLAETRHVIDPALTAKEALLFMARLVREHLFNPSLLILTGCAIPFIGSKIENGSAKRSAMNPWILSSLWICCMFATIVPVHLFSGWIPDRVLNVTSLLFIVGWFLTVIEAVRYYKMKGTFPFRPLSAKTAAFLISLAFLALFCKSNIRSAWGDLLSGSAYRFDQQLRQRYDAIRSCTTETCVVPPLTAFPRCLFYKDIDTQPDSWPNKPLASYFGKNAIVLSTPDLPSYK